MAIDKNTNKILSVGEEARKMLGRTPGNIVAIRPLKDGVISDFSTTKKMLKYFLDKVTKKRFFNLAKPKVIICIPSGATEVEQRAVIDASSQAGSARTYLIEEPIAAAIGAGVNISEANGTMIVDIGGGTTDIAVISLGGIVISRSIKVAGDKFDESIVRYVRKKYNVLIGDRTAEEIKKSIGSVYNFEDLKIEIKGRGLITGLPQILELTQEELVEPLFETCTPIIEGIKYVLEKTPPELISDISTGGIILTGGGSLINGIDKLIENETAIRTFNANDPISCVAIGTGKSLDNISILKNYSID